MLCQIFLYSVFLEISKSADYITHTWGLLPWRNRQKKKKQKMKYLLKSVQWRMSLIVNIVSLKLAISWKIEIVV